MLAKGRIGTLSMEAIASFWSTLAVTTQVLITMLSLPSIIDISTYSG